MIFIDLIIRVDKYIYNQLSNLSKYLFQTFLIPYVKKISVAWNLT